MSFLLTAIGWIGLIIITIWTSGALFYDVGRGSNWGWCIVAGWLTFVCGSVLLLTPFFYSVLLVTAVFAILLAWWFTQIPSNDRDWDPNFSQLCRIQIDGDQVVAEHVRNTQYASLSDFDLKYETREYRLSDLHAADVLILFWGSSWMCHPMVIFDFDGNRHLCISVEVRYRQGQAYSIPASLYRQYELMYVVSDERDAILRRTKFSEHQDCYLYRLQIDLKSVRQLFQEYVDTLNELAQTPRWYHAVTDNCTTSILKKRVEKVDLDVRFFLNGALDKLLYERGRIDNRLTFEDLKKQSRINDSANCASAQNFSAAIRRNLPGFD